MLYAIVAVLALIVDQAVKYWTTVKIVLYTGEAKLIPGFVHLAHLRNEGAAFGILSGARWLFVILCIIFVLIVVYALAKNLISNKVARWAAVFVCAGAVGNCIDRIVCGYVVDMFEFDFRIFGRDFPVFNVADIYITLGIILFCICILAEKPKPRRTNVPLAEAAAEEAPKARRRTQIPDFPKRAPVQEPPVDPSDPFAEWERPTSAAQGGARVYSQPAAAEKNYSPEAVDFVNSLAAEAPQPAPEAPDFPPPAFETPEAPQPAEPAAFEPPAFGSAPAAETPAPAPQPGFEAAPAFTPPKPAQPEETTYNLDDILAEFRDL